MTGIITLSAIFALAVLEIFAIVNGVDGTTFLGVAAIIGGLGGYQIHKLKDKNKKK
ncbi:hypothetical protein ES703_120033 [subsurface metagenome]